MEAGLAKFQVEDPREVSLGLRSARWTTMCEALEAWPEIQARQQCRLALLLHALCFYSLISRLISDVTDAKIAADVDQAELAYWCASARYILGLRGRVADYIDADLSAFERIVAVAPRDEVVALNAALKILVHKAKIGAPGKTLVEWRARTEKIAEAVVSRCDGFTRALLLSRFYRAIAFVPQRRGNRSEVAHTMDLAEHHASTLAPKDETQDILYRENLHPVLESRTKEALWAGDLDLALERALRVVELDPYDSKAWLELGEVRLRRSEPSAAAEAYATAATLGPPSTAIGRHMAGRCFRDLGQPLLAAFFFKTALDADPHAISPHDEIQALPDVPVLSMLKAWSLRSFRA